MAPIESGTRLAVVVDGAGVTASTGVATADGDTLGAVVIGPTARPVATSDTPDSARCAHPCGRIGICSGLQ